MNQPKVHLRGPRWRAEPKAACGLRDPRRHTNVPSEVTCRLCRHTLAMADAELRARRRSIRLGDLNRKGRTDAGDH